MTRHFLNGSINCSCTNCDRKANDEEETNEEERKKKNLSQEEEKEKKVDDIAKAQEEEDKKKLLKDKESMMHMTDEELNNLMADLQDQLDQLKKEMNLDDPKKKDSKHASKYNSSEFLGVDSQITKTKQSTYSVLALEPYHDNTTIGDNLLIRMGSTDDHTVGNSKDDEFLKMLGSLD